MPGTEMSFSASQIQFKQVMKKRLSSPTQTYSAVSLPGSNNVTPPFPFRFPSLFVYLLCSAADISVAWRVQREHAAEFGIPCELRHRSKYKYSRVKGKVPRNL